MSRMPELVSVVIPAYNARDVIDLQLEALAAQDYAGATEVVVGDNGSSDGLQEYLDTHALRERLSLRCVPAPEVQGASHARNVAVAAAQGDLLAFCDADDRAHPGWLSALVEAASQYDMVSGALENTSLNSPDVADRMVMQPPEQGFAFPGFLPFANGGTCAVWRSAFDQAGAWDESFTGAGEDVDLSWRVQLSGGTFGHAPRALMAYRMRCTYRELWNQSMTYGEADPRLFKQYRSRGYARNLLAFPVVFTLLLLRNPLLPRRVTRLSRGQWLIYAGRMVGRVRGSIRCRVYFL
ncbi:glycosyltransferase [Rhodococcus sp. ABRD24]|uniref:glycosyltransferase n=1 Tax=Rhodococcus sp. ABRD24 TaxID=2507582 RepID=UPI00103C1410|nr:glycosyltransferase [Rhodococcus sp. ABRD24]QBJ97852.1 glycosyltransferase [Rhodococcus sp. ABRD24]